MSYKTILLHVDESPNLAICTEIGAKIPMNQKAHLVGAAMTGISRFIRDTVSVDPSSSAIAPYIMRQRADHALSSFEQSAGNAGAELCEKRRIENEATQGMILQARYSDLVVLGQENPDQDTPGSTTGFVESVVMSGGSPTLIIPYAGQFKPIAERVLIAWNASPQAMHAIRGALPLLKQAKIVEIMIFNPASQIKAYGEEPDADLALYLARHDVKRDVMKEESGTEIDVGNALLSLSAGLSCVLMVMGCYGHTRFREVLRGGATRTILKSMNVPVLMAH